MFSIRNKTKSNVRIKRKTTTEKRKKKCVLTKSRMFCDVQQNRLCRLVVILQLKVLKILKYIKVIGIESECDQLLYIMTFN